jgi:hypothetical protein
MGSGLETVTVNRLTCCATARSIDVLKSDKFEVLRRETNLESAMLDGRLTATLQIKGLRVGDSLDLATSRTYHDPMAGSRTEWRSSVDHSAWPDGCGSAPVDQGPADALAQGRRTCRPRR